ncbi:hypothetical protein K6119_05515 [Paracrocinitomix mangrovi]|uniref:hypothetical protein n=1 Tax=Paracrocinitomix mangrovi TaxID=2862509 RepID=UPI001C8CF92D|nr:hypothetical protein [Paracrocinitomix mangrovi]UKN02972.1 hypothetical protein K6119_05515 [Paracrocinitomix mangrovi]
MKKVVLMFAAAGLLLATPSCKKGENDPFLSLSSRKARFAGTWDLTGYTFNSTNTEPNGDYQTSASTLTNGVITSTDTDFDVSNGTSTTNTSTITLNKAQYVINKDGTWTSEMDYTATNTYDYTDIWGDDHTVTETSNWTSTESGNWSFVGKVKEGDVTYKNKERAMMNTLVSSGTSSGNEVDNNTTAGTTQTTQNGTSSWTNNYYSGEVAMTIEIDQLKGKEMIWKIIEKNSGTSSWTNNGTTNTSTDDVYESEEWYTWTIVK